MYTFMKVFFKTNLFVGFLHFQIQHLKSYLWFIFSMFDLNFVQNDLLYGYGDSTFNVCILEARASVLHQVLYVLGCY